MIGRKKKIAAKIARVILLALFLVAAVLPLYWIFITSLKGQEELYAFPLVYFPKHPSFDSYLKLFRISDFGRYFSNSLRLSLMGSLGAMAVAVISGFALSRFTRRRIKSVVELVLYFTQTIPTFIIMVPLFQIFSNLRLMNNLGALGVVYISTVVSFCTIMSKSFFDRIPASLEEAAEIDGCNLFQSITKVVLPITLPGMAAIFCFAFINIWNELFLAVMLINSNSKMTVPVALNSFISKTGISWDIMSAGIVVALIPSMVVFGVGQKYIVAGLTEGGVKG